MIGLFTKFAPWLASHLGIWFLMIWVAITLGAPCLRHVNFNSWLEKAIFSIALGLGLVSLLWFVLAISGVFSSRAIQTATILIAVFGAYRLWLTLRDSDWRVRWRAWFRLELLRPRFELIGLLALAILFAAYEIHLIWLSLFPPVAWDSTMYHLPLAREYLTTHKLTPHMGLPYPVLPALEHLLFSWGLSLGDDLHAHLIGHTFFILTVAGLVAFGIRHNNIGVGLAAASLWLAHPLVLLFQGTAYVDMGLTCYSFLAVYALKIFSEEKKSQWWFLSVTLAAMAAATKMPGLIILAGIVAWSFWALLKGWIARADLLKGWAAALVALPWFCFIAYHAGNPVWPMFPRLSQGWWHYSSLEVEAFAKSVGLPHTFWNFIRLPYELVVHPERFFPDDHLSFLPIVAIWPLAWIVSIKNRSVRWWTGWILFFTVAWFFSIQALRFLFPVMPMIGLAICESVNWVLSRRLASSIKRQMIFVAAICFLAIPTFVVLHQMLSLKGFFPPTTISERDDWLTAHCLSYPGVRYINSHTNSQDTIYLIGGSFLPYQLRPRVLSIDYDFGQLKVLNRKPNFVMDSTGSSFAWPQSPEWLAQFESDRPTWILFSHQGLKLPDALPFEHSTGNLYELVYASETAYVFHRTPLPGNVARERISFQSTECSPAVTIPPTMFEGYLDSATCQFIRGWVWNPNSPNCSLKVEIYDNGELLATIPAYLIREDLLAAGKGNGKHGFHYRLPNQLKDRRRHSISVKVSGSPIELSNAPQEVTCPP